MKGFLRSKLIKASAVALPVLSLFVSGCFLTEPESAPAPPNVTVDIFTDDSTETEKSSEAETETKKPQNTQTETASDDTSTEEEQTSQSQPEQTETSEAPVTKQKAVFRFAGDFTQAEEGGDGIYMAIMQALDGQFKKDITKAFSDDLLSLMADADIFMLNNEFTYSRRGTPVRGKDWTFRADPSRVENLKKLGVDCVGLANNHAFDWGEESMLDTLDTLDAAGIDHVGAGKNIDEAAKPVFYEIGGRTFSIIAATSVEKEWDKEYGMTRAATADSAGVLRTTDPERTLQAIKEAKEASDFCFVFVHWGIEMDEQPDDEQKTLAKAYIDAGADAIIGAHPHILQGIEFYNGKPVIYSLGNFWFNSRERATCLFEVEVDCDTLEMTVRFHPCLQKDCRTVLVTSEEARRQALKEEERLSFNISIDDDGTVREK